ncbi:MAG: AAA family ATPase [bacterium]
MGEGEDAAVRRGVARAADARAAVEGEVHKRIVGQDGVIELMLTGLVSRGHCLLVGVPGLAKTLLVQTLAEVLELGFSRIQFTPDLMPSDITGTDVLEEEQATGRRSFRFIRGPIFANIVLADEINRTPPKTQAALLQAMQEGRVTAAGNTYSLEPPFMVFATQNPIEQEGTYPLPEAQLDRFMVRIDVAYPSAEEELRIVAQETRPPSHVLHRVLGPEAIAELQDLALQMPTPEHVMAAAVKLCRASRPEDESAPKDIKKYVSWGAGPRAARFLVLGAKARALLGGRFAPSTEDVRALAMPVLRHRLLRNFHAEAEGVTVPELVERLIAHCL